VFRDNKVRGRASFLFLSLIFLFFLEGCQFEKKNVDTRHSSIEKFIKDYDASSGDKVIEHKKDSVGEVVLSLPNSLENRTLIKELGRRTKNDKKYAKRLVEYAIKSHDTTNIGEGYLLIGDYYSGLLKYDSAYAYYYQAEKMFLPIKDSLNLSYALFLKAHILSKNGVYSDAEYQILESIRYNTSKTFLRRKYQQYFTIGDVFSGLGLYDDALYFYKQSLSIINSKDILKEVDSKTLELHRVYILGKIAFVYLNRGHHEKAEKILVNTISKHIDFSNIDSERYYSYLAVNLAIVRMKQNVFSGVKSLLEQAVDIGKKNKNRIVIHNAQIGLAEYYYLTHQEDLATSILEKVVVEAQSVSDFLIELQALELLVTYSGVDSPKYFEEYLKKNKIQKGESSVIRNNFIRIKNETDKLLQQNKELGNKNKQLAIIGCGLFILLASVLMIYLYRAKERKLKIVKMFHRDTEHYYNSIINIQNHLTLSQEIEQRSLAKELNDGVYNKLFAIRFYLTFLDKQKVIEEKSSLVEVIVEVEKYIREMSHFIDNESIKEVSGFVQLLRELVMMQKRLCTIKFDFNIDEGLDLERLNHTKRVNIYRSIQEVLLNVVLHSQASQCNIVIKSISLSTFRIFIKDDGVGFDLRKVKTGLGLINIKERIEIIDGKFFIFSQRGAGTKVIFNLPYAK
jgi:signal transduction histidine kinase